MRDGWRFTGNPVSGTKVESWTRSNNEDSGSAWVQVIGCVSYDDEGDPFFPFGEVEHQQFHAAPPIETDELRLWRYL